MLLDLNQKMRAGHVRRWHIVAVSREQTVAEHSYRVQLITEHLLKAIGAYNWNNRITLDAMEWARVHDIAEVITGDMPSNTKGLLGKYGGAEAYAMMSQDIDGFGRWADSEDEDDVLVKEIVKLADLLEAADWLGMVGVGRHAREVLSEIRSNAIKHAELVKSLVLKSIYTFPSWDDFNSVVAIVNHQGVTS